MPKVIDSMVREERNFETQVANKVHCGSWYRHLPQERNAGICC